MRLRALSVIVLVATTIAIGSGNLCLVQELDNQIELLLPHRDCDKFYQCTHGQPVEIPCPKGLYFSIIDQVCNWREDVDCGDRIISEDSKPGDEKHEEEVAIGHENLCLVQELDWKKELLLPHSDCDKFYQCTHGQAVEMTCPKGLYFSIIDQVCNWKEDVDCGDRIISEDSKPDDEKNEEEVDTAPEPDSDNDEDERPTFPVVEFLPNGCPVNSEIQWLLPHEKRCGLYYKCVQRKRYLKQCPFWLKFNRRLQICDWPRNTGCAWFQ